MLIVPIVHFTLKGLAVEAFNDLLKKHRKVGGKYPVTLVRPRRRRHGSEDRSLGLLRRIPLLFVFEIGSIPVVAATLATGSDQNSVF
jgi:hypothetical protein